jgi:hypothetical protein
MVGVLSFSQFKAGLAVSGNLTTDDGVTNISMSLVWPNLPMLNSPHNAATWMYGALSQLIQNFDDHTVMVSEHGPTHLCEEHRCG